MITYAESAEFLSDIQTMIDLDFDDTITVERLTSTPENDPWDVR